MCRRDVEVQQLDQRGEPRRLPFGKLKHQPRQSGCVDDRVLERALESAPDEPGVKRIVAVLDQHRALRETQECPTRILELRGADQHRALDVMTAACIRVDGCAAVDEGVEEGQWAVELESLGADLQHEKRGVAGGFDVQGHVLSFLERGLRFQLRGVDRDLLPRHGLDRAARLEQNRFRGHLASAKALRANAISSEVTARRSSAAPA